MCKKALMIAITLVFVLSMSELVLAANTSIKLDYGTGNTILHNQLGDKNFAYTYVKGNSNSATIDQTGEYNRAQQTQNGQTPLTADIKQTGDRNNATQNQKGYSHEATITQTGYSNIASQTQSGGLPDKNKADIIQTGSKNIAHQIQSHSGNTATITQDGSNNFAKQSQINAYR